MKRDFQPFSQESPQMQMGDAVGILFFTFFIFYSGNLVQI